MFLLIEHGRRPLEEGGWCVVVRILLGVFVRRNYKLDGNP